APTEPAAAVVRGALELLQNIGIPLSAIDEVVHGTTIGANIVVERKGALTALITTAGFRDILVIQRQFRHSPLDLQLVKHEPLVERDLVFGVPERTLFDGTINLALDEDEVRVVAQQLIERGIKSVAISFLHAYVNPTNERRAQEILANEAPDIIVSLSSDVA